uniref:CDI domain-containing protein n=1 Tax=Caenorhabditis tropicalis TaxID=1561998 RepID=A0A1I7T4T1_9PELO
MYEVDSRKWNFDFTGGVPIVGADGDYEFESIPASDVPQFYREKTMRSRKVNAKRNLSPVSDTVEAPDEALFVVEPDGPLLVASTSKEVNSYEKPVTRSSSAKKTSEQKEADTLKQTKLTNYMPVRKRRSEVCLITAAASVQRSASIDANISIPKEKRGNKIGNINKGAPKRPLRFVPPNIPKSSVSDSALASSPRSPPPKKGTTSRRSRRPVEAGDY